MADDLTEEEFRRWHKPAEVLAMMPEHLPWEERRNEIAARLADDLIEAAAETLADKRGKRSFVRLRAELWERVVKNPTLANDLWSRGTYEHSVFSSIGTTYVVTARLYGVRFEPEGVRKMLQNITPRPSNRDLAAALLAHTPGAVAPDAAPPLAFPNLTKHISGPGAKPVPQPKLKAWFDAWKALYPPELQNNDTGLEHARATFPKHHVARQRIRGLRDAKTPGPKAAADLDTDAAE